MSTTPLPPLPEPDATAQLPRKADQKWHAVWGHESLKAYAQQARADLEAENARLQKALERAELFIDEIRQDLHHERIADWYPEGAHSSAASMSESMRVIGNRCADFESEPH